jgi:prophage antirepressor-like protein
MADLFSGATAQSTPSVFTFSNHTVRICVRDGEPWFVAKDVMAALGYSGHSAPAKVCEHIPAEWKGVNPIHTPGGEQNMLCLSEPGLYFFLGRSDKQNALPFQKWVYGEVLPAIRKTGGYAKPTVDAERIRLAHALASEASAQVARTVFDAVMAGDAQLWRHSRYLLNLNYDRDSKPTVPWCGVLPFEALAITIDELPERLTGPDAVSATDVQLARLAAACSQRLERRAQQRAEKESTRPGAALFKCTEPGKLTRV